MHVSRYIIPDFFSFAARLKQTIGMTKTTLYRLLLNVLRIRKKTSPDFDL